MQNTVTITVSDCPSPELAESIARAQWHKAEQSDSVIGYSHSDCFNIIASADNAVIGRVQCLRSMTDKERWLYGDIFIAPEYRRRHIAEKMVNAALDVLRDRGCRCVCAYVEHENMLSLSLLKKLGFKEAPYEPFDGISNEEELMFEMELTAYSAVHASEMTARYISEICETCAEPLHINIADHPSFYDEIARMLSANDPDEENFLIRSGAIPCAWLKLNGLADGTKTAWISMLAVAPPFQRHGAGEFAVRFAEKFSALKGKEVVRIHATEDNLPALSLYEKCGYAVTDSRRTVSGDGKERVRLTLEKELLS